MANPNPPPEMEVKHQIGGLVVGIMLLVGGVYIHEHALDTIGALIGFGGVLITNMMLWSLLKTGWTAVKKRIVSTTEK